MDDDEQPIETFPTYPVSREYVSAALQDAEYEQLADDEGWFASIPSFPGLWANAPTRDAVERELEDVLRSWISISVGLGQPVPEPHGVALTTG